MTRLVDSHCHLDFPDFISDIQEVITRAHAHHVSTMLTIATSIPTLVTVMKNTLLDNGVFIAFGVHPCHVGEDRGIGWREIQALCATPKIIGIGETGLDYHYPNANQSLQKENFIQHIIAAQETGLPLIVHTRDAGHDTIELLKTHMSIKPFKGVIHCFTESMEFAYQALDLGFYISFSGIVTFKNATALQEVAKIVPLERMLVETDAPYLAPVPYRGKRNEPSFVKYTAEFLSDLKSVHYDQFCDITTDNFYTLFNKAQQ